MLAAIALGSNLPSPLGGPKAHLEEALHRLGTLGTVEAVSSFHRTSPVGYLRQPAFLNAAALLRTELAALPLLHRLLAMEQAMGRVRSADVPPKGPRVLDLDLLLYEDSEGRSLIMQHPDLTLPHPEMHRRAFVLAPLAEIAPEWRHPVLGKTIWQLADALADKPA